MLFNSFSFVVFLVIAFVVYRLLHARPLPRFAWLLLVSAVFYASWEVWYLILIGISTLWSYAFGLAMGRTDQPERRRALVFFGIAGDLTLLGIFKYGNFLLDNLIGLVALLGVSIDLPAVPETLPVGISFYTFQTLSYTIDVYRRRIAVEPNLLRFAVFVFFFPQLVAGPIVRAEQFLPQLRDPPRVDPGAIGEGLFWILSGLIKKMILADTLGSLIVEPFFANPTGRNGLESLVTLWAANFQVYCDFSGYSDVAIGAALLFGFVLPQNFDRPFWSSTPMEYWRRWHITLSFWLRDYLFIPLGGSRGGPWRSDRNVLVTFLLGGLWHGAGWTFVAWGAYNGALLLLWRRLAPARVNSRWGRVVQWAVTFNAICIGLVFLFARSFADAWAVLLSLGDWVAPFSGALSVTGLLALLAAALLHATPLSLKHGLRQVFATAPAYAVAAVVVLCGAVLILFAGLARPFFYFQF